MIHHSGIKWEVNIYLCLLDFLQAVEMDVWDNYGEASAARMKWNACSDYLDGKGLELRIIKAQTKDRVWNKSVQRQKILEGIDHMKDYHKLHVFHHSCSSVFFFSSSESKASPQFYQSLFSSKEFQLSKKYISMFWQVQVLLTISVSWKLLGIVQLMWQWVIQVRPH